MSTPKIYNEFKEALFNASEEVKNDVLELKFGCEVRLKEEKEIDTVLYNEHYREPVISTIKRRQLMPLRLYEIIGRPITLEDVLKCLGGFHTELHFSRNTAFILVDLYKEEDLKILWKLGVPAFEQSDETLVELTKLLS